MKNKLHLVISAILLSSISTLAAGGGVVGSGGDGLISTNPQNGGTVVVPVPGQIVPFPSASFGKLEVDSNDSWPQIETIFANTCSTQDCGDVGTSGAIIEFSGSSAFSFPVNTETTVTPGTYAVCLAYSCEVVEVVAGQKTTLKLGKIVVPKVDGIKVSVYFDMNDVSLIPEFQFQFLMSSVGTSSDCGDVIAGRANATSAAKRFCNAKNQYSNTKDRQTLVNSLLAVQPNGQFFKKILTCNRSLLSKSCDVTVDTNLVGFWANVNDTSSSQSSLSDSLFPGIYGVCFTSASGNSFTPGIHVSNQ